MKQGSPRKIDLAKGNSRSKFNILYVHRKQGWESYRRPGVTAVYHERSVSVAVQQLKQRRDC